MTRGIDDRDIVCDSEALGLHLSRGQHALRVVQRQGRVGSGHVTLVRSTFPLLIVFPSCFSFGCAATSPFTSMNASVVSQGSVRDEFDRAGQHSWPSGITERRAEARKEM